MATKFKFLSLLMVLSMALTACGGSSDSMDSYDDSMDSMGSAESMDEIVFSTYAGDFLVQCADGWTCTEEYGGSITHDESYNGLMLYDVWGTDVDSVLQANVDQLLMFDTREVVETYEWTDGAMGTIVADSETGQEFWVTVFDAGLSDGLLKCQANFAEGTREATQADAEMMCGSATLQ